MPELMLKFGLPIVLLFKISGVKTFVNEFAAYDELGRLIDNRVNFYNWTETYNRNWSYTGDLDITFYPDDTFNTTDVLLYGYIQVSCFELIIFVRYRDRNEGENLCFNIKFYRFLSIRPTKTSVTTKH